MNKFIVGACAGVLSLAASQYAAAQAPEKSATKKAPAKKTWTKKHAAKKAAPVAAVKPEGVEWKCELGNEMYLKGDMARDQIITMYWKGKNYQLPRQMTRTGADRYFDQKTGMDLVVIPAKAMLFDRNEGHRLADECQTAEMAAGAPAPTQAGALRAPAGLPLMAPDSPAPAPAPAPGAVLPAQQ
ncbi:hypothetical protein ACQ4P5_01900 [Ralstonia sp. L16]|uniref:Uncharacterized protein n=1 Tax=Ralstonia wenshanensis TaxID=2842456 RepID=A0AAD2EN92_9RALS|nr:hypothetical protein [Ralstonia wenshanensis]MCT7305540.1 hypothetical protein [Ralstonia wenshanensis]MDY7508391.1 hypothetical protein [Ralstonia wenshanensis]UGS89668.1 hypothetical protein KOL96_17055 [Ralstonia wenshanensis]CAJ0695277.1 hypothetical protein LMG18091_02084 [Ralstonia wenshanensis]CAJ0812984.1 hypothetical protein LMG19087_01625 [Ralstonia wenshanensis]